MLLAPAVIGDLGNESTGSPRQQAFPAPLAHQPGAAWRDDLLRLVSLPSHSRSSSGQKPYSESDHFSGGGSSHHMEPTTGIIEVEIDGMTVRIGRGAEVKTVGAVLQTLTGESRLIHSFESTAPPHAPLMPQPPRAGAQEVTSSCNRIAKQ
jgi:hypothetical protein